MKNFRLWSWVGMAAAGVALSGCGGSGDDSSGNASLRVVNATLTHPSIDLLVNSTVVASATASDNVSAYSSPSSGSAVVQINDAGSGTSLVSANYTLTGGAHYTVVAYESGGALKTFTVAEDVAAPATGVATLRVYDAAYEAGKLDVYVITGACTTANLTPLAPTTNFAPTSTAVSAFTLPTQAAGNYNVCITALGSKTDLRLSMPITLAGAQVANLVLTPAAGGQLLNGSLVVQQGSAVATRNPNARVRLASAVSGGAVVNAVTGAGASIDSSRSPALGFYTLVPASSTLNISVNGGASVGSPAAKLTAGADFTLLVTGDVSAPTAALITDDNRAPTDTTTTRVRLINGVNGGVGSLTLTANNSPIGVNVAPGAASTYASVQGAAGSATTAVTLTLSSSTAGTYPTYSNTFNTGVTYSVLAGDGATSAAPQLIIR